MGERVAIDEVYDKFLIAHCLPLVRVPRLWARDAQPAS